MRFNTATLITGAVLATSGEAISVTPHTMYSSSIGVLGCKLANANVDRIAYFPGTPDCDNLCYRLTSPSASLTVLHIDSSGGAYDVSYDAWNRLATGQSVADNPTMGGGIEVTMESVPMDQCSDILVDGKLPFSAPTGTNLIVACPAGSFVRDNSTLYNIYTSTCTYGTDESCTLDDTTMQPTCPSGVGQGASTPLTVNPPVMNYVYGTSQRVKAP